VQVIAQLTARVEDVHINNRNFRSFGDSRRHNSRQRIVESLDVRIETRLPRRNDLSHNDNGIRHSLEDVVQKKSKPPRCVGVWLRCRVSTVEIVRTGMQQDNIGARCKTWGHDATNLADGVARVALVVFVGHGSGLLVADEVDGVARGLQIGEKALTVAV
jgi:hypothetical protein